MTYFTRRTLVKGGTAAAAAGALTGPALFEWAQAWAQTAPWKPEKETSRGEPVKVIPTMRR